LINDLKDFSKMFSDYTGFNKNKYSPLVWINGEPEIGNNTTIGFFSEINAKDSNIKIGNNCDIASFVSINCADSHNKCIGLSKDINRQQIVIRDNVFIGSHCVIKGGAYLDHHCVVAAGTVVNCDFYPSYSLVYGNPTKCKEHYYREKLKENR